jgi:hypothetical protein
MESDSRRGLREFLGTHPHSWAASRALLGGVLRGSNPFSEACEIAIQYGKDTIIKDDRKKIFDDSELDSVIAKMLKLDAVKR